MERVSVESKAIEQVGWERRVLELRFTTGRTYRYFGVPERVYSQLLGAESKGRFFNERIRDSFRYREV